MDLAGIWSLMAAARTSGMAAAAWVAGMAAAAAAGVAGMAAAAGDGLDGGGGGGGGGRPIYACRSKTFGDVSIRSSFPIKSYIASCYVMDL